MERAKATIAHIPAMMEADSYTFKVFMAFPIEMHATFADPICVNGALDEDFCQTQLQTITPEEAKLANRTSIGNLAYLGLYAVAKREEHLQSYHDLLRFYTEETDQGSECVVS